MHQVNFDAWTGRDRARGKRSQQTDNRRSTIRPFFFFQQPVDLSSLALLGSRRAISLQSHFSGVPIDGAVLHPYRCALSPMQHSGVRCGTYGGGRSKVWDIRRWPERRYTADGPCGTGLWPCVEPGCFYSAAKRLCETPGSYSARLLPTLANPFKLRQYVTHHSH